jgi:mRNA interferase RelE/StbE
MARKQLHSLDRPIQKKIADYLADRIEGCKNPRHFGEALSANRVGLWRYRLGDYRIICEIQDDKVIVLVLTIGHRREIYK